MSDEKKIEIINGNGEELEISPVYNHIDIEKPDINKKQEIIVPKSKSRKKNDKISNENEEEEQNDNKETEQDKKQKDED